MQGSLQYIELVLHGLPQTKQPGTEEEGELIGEDGTDSDFASLLVVSVAEAREAFLTRLAAAAGLFNNGSYKIIYLLYKHDKFYYALLPCNTSKSILSLAAPSFAPLLL